MRFTAHRVFFVWDFEEEEKWINEMAAKGMNLQGIGFCKYVFEEGTPGELPVSSRMAEKQAKSSRKRFLHPVSGRDRCGACRVVQELDLSS